MYVLPLLRRSSLVFLLGVLGLLVTGLGVAPAVAGKQPSTDVRVNVAHDVSPPLREMPVVAPITTGAAPETQPAPAVSRESVLAGLAAVGPDAPWNRPEVAPLASNGPMPEPSVNFAGMTNPNGYYPPDTNGDVGPNHYVEMVNVSFAVFDKTGNKLYGPVNNNTLWGGFGGACQITNNGDPIVQYDGLADRWVLSQFSVTGPSSYECIAVSATPDPLGSYYRYAFDYGDDFPDYPKIGVWPDGYYVTYNGSSIFGGVWPLFMRPVTRSW